MNRPRLGAVLGASALGLALLPAAASTAATSDHGKHGPLRVCVYGLGLGDSAAVTVDGAAFATFPADGKCEKDRLKKGFHQLVITTEGTSLDRAVVKDKSGNSNGSDASSPVSVFVKKGQQTRVNIYFTG